MELFLLYPVIFILSFFGTSFLLKNGNFLLGKHICPQKEVCLNLVNHKRNNKILMREVKEYSLHKIQNGHFEYTEVLKSLTCKGNKNDKEAKNLDEVNA